MQRALLLVGGAGGKFSMHGTPAGTVTSFDDFETKNISLKGNRIGNMMLTPPDHEHDFKLSWVSETNNRYVSHHRQINCDTGEVKFRQDIDSMSTVQNVQRFVTTEGLVFIVKRYKTCSLEIKILTPEHDEPGSQESCKYVILPALRTHLGVETRAIFFPPYGNSAVTVFNKKHNCLFYPAVIGDDYMAAQIYLVACFVTGMGSGLEATRDIDWGGFGSCMITDGDYLLGINQLFEYRAFKIDSVQQVIKPIASGNVPGGMPHCSSVQVIAYSGNDTNGVAYYVNGWILVFYFPLVSQGDFRPERYAIPTHMRRAPCTCARDRETCPVKGHFGEVCCLAFSPANKYVLASATYMTKQVLLTNTRTGTVLRVVQTDFNVKSLGFVQQRRQDAVYAAVSREVFRFVRYKGVSFDVCEKIMAFYRLGLY